MANEKKPGLLSIIVGIVLFLVGAYITVTLVKSAAAITELRISDILLSVAVVAGGVAFIIRGVSGLSDKRNALKGKKISHVIKNEIKASLLPDFSTEGDSNETEEMLTKFRADYAQFFDQTKKVENAAIQNDVTQIFRNVLEMQRIRLQKLGMKLDFESERKCYGDEPLDVDEYFDGKYEIQEIDEDIATKTTITKKGKNVYSQVFAQKAHYTVVKTKQQGVDQIICPNCGALTTRSDLLDGCDFCGTKFAIEDLGERVASFSLRKNADVDYSKYQKYSSKFMTILGTIIAAPVFFFNLLIQLKHIPENLANYGVASVVVSLFFAPLVTSMILILIVYMFLSNGIQYLNMAADVSYSIQKSAEESQNTSEQDNIIVQDIRVHDSLFSLSNFYSNVENKMATVLYADNKMQAGAFASDSWTPNITPFKKVAQFDVNYIGLQDYRVENGKQNISVKGQLSLIEDNGIKCRTRIEKFHMRLSKNADCKTQVVCAPSILKCKGCGTSLSLLEGKVCPACGLEIDMEAHDWVIRDFEVGVLRYTPPKTGFQNNQKSLTRSPSINSTSTSNLSINNGSLKQWESVMRNMSKHL